MCSNAKVAAADVEPGVCGGGRPMVLPAGETPPSPVGNRNDSTPNETVFTVLLITRRLRADIASACRRVASDAARHQEHDQYHHQQADHTAGRITPAFAVRPCGNYAQQRQNQHDQKYRSQCHFSAPRHYVVELANLNQEIVISPVNPLRAFSYISRNNHERRRRDRNH